MTPKPFPIAVALTAAALIAAAQLAMPSASADPPAAVRQAMSQVLSRYETIRAALAADRGVGIAAASRSIEAAAREARGASSGSLSRHIEALQTAAGRLALAPEGDLAALRRAFGELNRSLVAILAAEPSLASGLRVFECSMAEGYGKWIQRSTEIQNPYMGPRMLGCGMPSEWRP